MLRPLPHSRRLKEPRKGIVLLAVLVVVVLLSLAAYSYSDLMTAEYKASVYYHKTAQTKAFADSGIHYAMAALSSNDSLTSLLNGNPFNNSSVLRNHAVGQGADKNSQGFFTLVAPVNPNSSSAIGSYQFGVIDESSKININAVMKSDPTGTTLYNMLLLLPNMTDDIANSIIDWVDTDTTTRQGGAESDYYNGLSPPYNAKNGPLDSLEELLLVKGVTPQLLFGIDLNRNNYQDPNEVNDGSSATSGFDRGWSAFLTIYSREQNLDPTGLALTNLNDNTIDLETMYGTLSSALSDDLAKFIIMYRQYGPSSSSSGGAQSATQTVMSLVGGKSSNSGPTGTPGVLSSFPLDVTKKASNKINSLYDLITAQVSITTQSTSGSGKNAKTTSKTVIYKSPLSDPGQQATLLPLLFQKTTTFAATEIPARVNMNTAPLEVLSALPNLNTADVQAIMAAQPQYGDGETPDPMYETPAWLITQANISPSKLSKLDSMITTRSQVFRIQSLGHFEQNKGLVTRVEAIIDINGGQPRILSWRDMGDFGRVRPPQ